MNKEQLVLVEGTFEHQQHSDGQLELLEITLLVTPTTKYLPMNAGAVIQRTNQQRGMGNKQNIAKQHGYHN